MLNLLWTVFKDVHQDFDRQLAHFESGHAHGGQRRVRVRGEINIVEASIMNKALIRS